MDIFSHLRLYMIPYTLVAAVVSYMVSGRKNKSLPPIEKSRDINEDRFEVVPYKHELDDNIPIIYHQYIDEVVENYSHIEMILKRIPSCNVVPVYMFHSVSSDRMDEFLIPIYLQRYNDNIRIRCQDTTYEWYPHVNILYGPDRKILFHFKNRPNFEFY